MDRLLERCCIREAVKADDVAECLLSLSQYVPEYRIDIEQLFNAVWTMERLLDRLPHEFYVYRDFTNFVIDDLNLLLVTVQCTLDLMRETISHSEIVGPRRAWLDMREHLRSEIGSSVLWRFLIFNEFIDMIRKNLRRVHVDGRRQFDVRDILTTLHSRQSLNRGVPALLPAGVLVPYLIPQITPEASHWAESIFESLGHHPTRMRSTSHRRSQCWGPFRPNHDLAFPARSKVLFKLTFHDGFSIKLCLYPLDVPKLLCRDTLHQFDSQSCLPIGELKIKRRGRSCLHIMRWSVSRRREWTWAVLYFDIWEKMVLFWCTFMAFKWRCTSLIDRTNYELGGEELQFRATITDDRYSHSLSIYRDIRHRGVRLEAKAFDGSMRRCPIWTAFVTHACQSRRWLVRRGNKVYIREIHLYVFSADYRSRNQRVGPRGEFMLEFVHREAARGFVDAFAPLSDPPSPAGSAVGSGA